MSSAEFGEWLAFYKLEPFGFRADFWRTGIATAATVNNIRAMLAGKHRPKMTKADDFIPDLERDYRPRTSQGNMLLDKFLRAIKGIKPKKAENKKD